MNRVELETSRVGDTCVKTANTHIRECGITSDEHQEMIGCMIETSGFKPTSEGPFKQSK